MKNRMKPEALTDEGLSDMLECHEFFRLDVREYGQYKRELNRRQKQQGKQEAIMTQQQAITAAINKGIQESKQSMYIMEIETIVKDDTPIFKVWLSYDFLTIAERDKVYDYIKTASKGLGYNIKLWDYSTTREKLMKKILTSKMSEHSIFQAELDILNAISQRYRAKYKTAYWI